MPKASHATANDRSAEAGYDAVKPKSWESRAPNFESLNACKSGSFGRLAQLGEHQLDKLGVTGSSPVPPILVSGVVKPF